MNKVLFLNNGNMEKVFVDVCCTSGVWYNLYTRFIFKFVQETDNIHCETMELNALETGRFQIHIDFCAQISALETWISYNLGCQI